MGKCKSVVSLWCSSVLSKMAKKIFSSLRIFLLAWFSKGKYELPLEADACWYGSVLPSVLRQAVDVELKWQWLSECEGSCHVLTTCAMASIAHGPPFPVPHNG